MPLRLKLTNAVYDMTQTLAALLSAHVMADFVLQTARMEVTKRNPATPALHGIIVLGTAIAATAALSPWLLVLAAHP